MPYTQAYKERQKHGVNLPLSWYVDDACELSWVDGIDLVAVEDLNPEHVIGYIVKHDGSLAAKLTHNYTVCVAQGLERPVEKFIVIKEIMHCYFNVDDGSQTDNSFVLEAHMREMFGNSATTQSSQVRAENLAFWMALGLVCPEAHRLELQAILREDESQLDALAVGLGVPSGILNLLVSPQYEDEIREILK